MDSYEKGECNMKLNITVEDLMELSEWQKKSLRSLWIPEKYDLAVAFICMNVETDEIDRIEFVVGDVLAKETNREKSFEARKYPAIYDCYDVTLRSLRQVNEEEIVEEENFDYEYIRPVDYFNLEYCLPLLSIGQMIRILEELGFKSSDYFIKFNSNTKKYSLERPELDYLDEAFEAEELCDVLWNRLKGFLE